jgi:hypothetical protein
MGQVWRPASRRQTFEPNRGREGLREEFGTFSVRRGGVAAGDCVRIATALFTSADNVDHLAQALRVVAV